MNIYPAEFNSMEAQLLLHNPILKALHTGTEDGIVIAKPDTFFLIGTNDESNVLYGGLELRPITDRLVDIHIHILPEFWGTEIAGEFAKECIQWAKANTQIKYAVTETPSVCKNVISFLNEMGFQRIHVFKNGVTYNKKAADLLIYRYNVKRK